VDAAAARRPEPSAGSAVIGIHDGVDPSIAVLQDGVIHYAARTERLTRVPLQDLLRDAGSEVKVACHVRADRSIWQWRSHQSRRRELLAAGYHGKIQPVDTHRALAAAAYYTAPWSDQKTMVLIYDALGARAFIAENGKFTECSKIGEFDSLERFSGRVARGLGLAPMDLMHLGAHASGDLFADLFQLAPDSPGHRRRRKVSVTKILHRNRFDTIAASVQRTVESVLTEWVKNLMRETAVRRFACSGSLFANPRANLAILEIPRVEALYVFPSCGMEATSIGAACEIAAAAGCAIQPVASPCWGDAILDEDAEAAIRSLAGPGVHCRRVAQIERVVAENLARGNIVARVRGAAEFGANPLGNRSVLCKADSLDAAAEIRRKLRRPEFWTPLVLSVLAERSCDYLEKPASAPFPHATIAARARPEKRHALAAAIHPRDAIACPHEVLESHNPDYWRLLREYEEITGEAALVCTSFQIAGEPPVYSARDAVSAFLRSGLDFMALGNWWIARSRTAT